MEDNEPLDFDLVLLESGTMEMISPPASEPEERPLWRAVLCQLLYDGTRPTHPGEDSEVASDRDAARRFFTKVACVTAQDFEAVCEYAGFTASRVRTGFLRLIENGRTFYRRTK